ncbi:MAG: acyltransferase [Tenuifilaceae bacterium]|nr:acyltransferase [Tenuifilaceae bacterium]
MGFLGREEIENMGFGQVGKNVLLSDKASYYNCANIFLGSNVRVDDFCTLSAGVGGIFIGDYIHIAVYSSLIGAGRIILSDFSNISSRVSIYSSNDDYTGSFMTNPMVDKSFTHVQVGDVTIGRHVIVGSGSVIMPGVILEEGVAVGALSFVNKNCRSFMVYAGVPVSIIKERKRDLLLKEYDFLRGEIF